MFSVNMSYIQFMHLRIAAMNFDNVKDLQYLTNTSLIFYVDFGQLCLLLLNTPWKSHTKTCVWGAEGLRGTGIQFGRLMERQMFDFH